MWGNCESFSDIEKNSNFCYTLNLITIVLCSFTVLDNNLTCFYMINVMTWKVFHFRYGTGRDIWNCRYLTSTGNVFGISTVWCQDFDRFYYKEEKNMRVQRTCSDYFRYSFAIEKFEKKQSVTRKKTIKIFKKERKQRNLFHIFF